MRRLRVVTFNVGLMRVGLFGCGLFENPAGVARRAGLLPARVRRLCAGADVVCLQECYEEEHRRALRDCLLPELPYLACSRAGGLLLNSGLVTVSRHPLLASGRVPHTAACAYERLLGDRAMLFVVLDVGGAEVGVVNAHLSSGLPADSRGMSAVRAEQVADLDRLAGRLELEHGARAVLVAGDFNCSPGVDPGGYAGMLRRGWRDAWREAGGAAGGGWTWDRANPLNAGKPAAQGASQRCDQVWVARARGAWGAGPCGVEADAARPLSDHYPVAAEIRFTAQTR